MPLYQLPLQCEILREYSANTKTNINSFGFENYPRSINWNRRTFPIQYKPLNYADKSTVMAFLDVHENHMIFLFTPNDEIEIKVKVVENTLEETYEGGGQYTIKCTLEEQFNPSS